MLETADMDYVAKWVAAAAGQVRLALKLALTLTFVNAVVSMVTYMYVLLYVYRLESRTHLTA